MPVNLVIDISGLKKNILNNSVPIVKETTNAVYLDVRKFSPIDTGKYQSGHKNLGVTVDKNKVTGTIENVGPYPESVEGGWSKKAVNWHLNNIGQIYNSVGANVYQKAVNKNKDLFIKKLTGQ